MLRLIYLRGNSRGQRLRPAHFPLHWGFYLRGGIVEWHKWLCISCSWPYRGRDKNGPGQTAWLSSNPGLEGRNCSIQVGGFSNFCGEWIGCFPQPSEVLSAAQVRLRIRPDVSFSHLEEFCYGRLQKGEETRHSKSLGLPWHRSWGFKKNMFGSVCEYRAQASIRQNPLTSPHSSAPSTFAWKGQQLWAKLVKINSLKVTSE